MPKLTLSRLKEVLHYNPKTGVFTNRITRCNRAIKGTVTGCVNPNGYLLIQIDGTLYRAHRLAYFYENGRWPPADLDHRNGVRDDNRIKNLRPATKSINNKNAKLRKDSTTGVCGVYFDKRRKKYRAQIMIDGKHISLGCYTLFEDAVAARKAAEIEHNFHPNHGLTKKQRAKK